MSTILFPSPIFGPVQSRRLGTSLGINLLPADGKLCNFNCIYCECGWNEEHRPHQKLPSKESVQRLLTKTLQEHQQQNKKIDVITFAGNGEPTLHPDFPTIIARTLQTRDQWMPKAKVCVLTNATTLDDPSVLQALLNVDQALLKVDTVQSHFHRLVNQPQKKYDINHIIETIQQYPKHFTIQTMFLRGRYKGENISNTTEQYVQPWLDALQKMNPKDVSIYTIARDTPHQGLQKASPDTLDLIAKRVRALGYPCQVSY